MIGKDRRRDAQAPPGGGSFVVLSLLLGLCLGVGALGAWTTAGSVATWYPTLVKPAWNPPSWVFGPVWTALYLGMAVAAWLVWRAAGWRGSSRALGWFAAQLALNAAWSPLFFGLRSPAAAFLDIAALWVAIVATIAAFFRVSRPAAALLLPYLAWVSFAAALNAAIWRMN